LGFVGVLEGSQGLSDLALQSQHIPEPGERLRLPRLVAGLTSEGEALADD
jgi:hypothetical protein